jgi:hypothetical protein
MCSTCNGLFSGLKYVFYTFGCPSFPYMFCKQVTYYGKCMRMHILMAATAIARAQAEVSVDGRFEFQAGHCPSTVVLPSGLYQPACSIFLLMKVITANMYANRLVRQDRDA